jgi:hypothetical protein
LSLFKCEDKERGWKYLIGSNAKAAAALAERYDGSSSEEEEEEEDWDEEGSDWEDDWESDEEAPAGAEGEADQGAPAEGG